MAQTGTPTDFARPLQAKRLATSQAFKSSAWIPDALVGASRKEAPRSTTPPGATDTRRKNIKVTIYGSNAETAECSSETLEFAEVARCYNTSWVYYSIDSCIKPELLANSSTAVPSPTSTGSENKSPPVGTIVGAVLGGIVALGILVGVLVYIFYFRRKRNKQVEQPEEPGELPSVGKTEMPAEKDNEPRFELSPEGLKVELDQPDPVEMEGDARYPAEVGTS